jgi:hypothetical protein
MNTLFPSSRFLRAAGAVAFVILAAALAAYVGHWLGFTAGSSLAAAGTVVGPAQQSDDPDDHRTPSVTDMITRLDASSFPFTTLMDRLPRVAPAKQVIHKWGEVSSYPREDAINGAVTAGSANSSKTVTVDNGSQWREGDVFMAPDNSTSPGAMFFVSEVAGNDLTVWQLPSSTDATPWSGDNFDATPAFDDNEAIYWVSNVKSENDTASDARQMEPAYKFNFVQTVDALIEWSDHKLRSENYGEQDQARHRKESLREFRRSLEFGFIFNGPPSVTTDPVSGDPQWSMGGLRHYINTSISLPRTSATEKDLVSFIYESFVGDNGSPRKLLMGGSDFLEAIDKVAANADALSTSRQESIAGVELQGLDSRVGMLDTVYHPGFDEQGRTDEATVVDLNHIVKRDYQPMERRVADLKRSGDLRDAESEYYITKCTIEVRNSEAHRWCTLS